MSKAKFQIVLKVIRDENTVAESERSVDPVWNLSPPSGNLMSLSDEDLKVHVSSILIRDLSGHIRGMVVELLTQLDRETRVVYSDPTETE